MPVSLGDFTISTSPHTPDQAQAADEWPNPAIICGTRVNQQKSRMLALTTIEPLIALIRRLTCPPRTWVQYAAMRYANL
jgi:hypothetical protein